MASLGTRVYRRSLLLLDNLPQDAGCDVDNVYSTAVQREREDYHPQERKYVHSYRRFPAKLRASRVNSIAFVSEKWSWCQRNDGHESRRFTESLTTHLNLCVLSNTMPQTTEPNIPAQTIVKPIRPASCSCPCKEENSAGCIKSRSHRGAWKKVENAVVSRRINVNEFLCFYDA